MNVLLKTELINNDTPLLLSKDSMKKAKTYTDFSKNKIVISDEEVSLKFSTPGHYCIAVGKMNKKDENLPVSEDIVCF